MIHEVDESLRTMINSGPVNGGAEVSFDAPTRDWAARQGSPAINVFLYDIREDLSRRDVAPRVIKDEAGHVVGRRPPARRFKLSYLLTAWTQRAEDEHRLLAGLLSHFLQHDAIPKEHLEGSLGALDLPVILGLALPAGPERSLSDIWSALGGELKPSLDLNVVAPLDPERSFEVGPPVLEDPLLDLGRSDPDGSRPYRVATTLEDDVSEERVAGKKKPGRTLRIKRVPAPRS